VTDIPLVIERIHRLIRKLEDRRADELYINGAGNIEFAPEEIEEMIGVLNHWAVGLDFASRGQTLADMKAAQLPQEDIVT
jgi:hypothetical protein